MNRRAQLKISLNSLASNIEELMSLCPNNKIIPMIKANAYGHGDIEIFNYIQKNFKIKQFGVASLEEALRIRKFTNSFESDLIVFSDTLLYEKEAFSFYTNNRIIPVISNKEDLKFFLSNSETNFLPLYLKMNTGMNRLGLEEKDLGEIFLLLKKYNREKVDHLMTHFSSSTEKINSQSKTFFQYEKFKKIKNIFEKEKISIVDSSVSNSGAIEQSFGLEETHIRPGLMVYGPSALDYDVRSKSKWKGECISSLQASVLKVSNMQKGSEIGYGNTVCPKDGDVLLLGIGYGDGFSTSMTGLHLKSDKVKGQVIGKVNMDMTAILLDERSLFHRGDYFEIWNKDSSSLLSISDQQGLIPYEIFCNLGTRVDRVYLN